MPPEDPPVLVELERMILAVARRHGLAAAQDMVLAAWERHREREPALPAAARERGRAGLRRIRARLAALEGVLKDDG